MADFNPNSYGNKRSKLYNSSSEGASSKKTYAPVDLTSRKKTYAPVDLTDSKSTFDPSSYGDSKSRLYKDAQQSVFSRAKKTVTGGLKGSLAGNMDTMGVAYQAGQGGRTQRNTAALKDAQWAVARAKYAYDADKTPASAAEMDNALKQMKAYATVLGDGAYDQALKAAYAASSQMGTADLNKLYESLGKVNVNPATGVQQKATEASRDLAAQVQKSASKDIESAKTGVGTFGGMLIDAGASMVQMGGDLAGNALLGTSGSMIPFAARAFGGGTMQARESGADLNQQIAYGAALAGKEVLTEKMFSIALPFAKAYGGGALDDVTQKAIQTAVNKLGKTAAGKRALNAALQLTASGASEGLEELIGDWMEWQMPRIYGGDVDTASETLANSLYDFAVGGLSGVAGGVISPNTYRYGNYAADVQQNTAPEMDSKAAEAVEAVTRGEAITGNQAASIARDPVAVETLETNTGVKLNTEQPLSALKKDIQAVSTRDTARETQTAANSTPAAQKRTQRTVGGFMEAGQKAYQTLRQTAENEADLYAGFSSVYNAGLNGIEASKAKGRYADLLTPEQRYAAYNAGLEDAAAQVAQENADVASVTTTAGAGLVDNEYSRAIIAKSKNTASVFNAVGKKLGVRIEFVDKVMGGKANGQYIREQNLIQIATDGKKPYLAVAAHEITHRMQDLSPVEYRKFRKAALEYRMRENGADTEAEWVDTYIEIAEQDGVTLTQDEAMDEIAADFAGEMLDDIDLFERFTKENRTVAQKLLDSLKEFIAKVKSIFTGESRDKAAQDAYCKSFGELETVAQKWQTAFDAAEHQARNANTAASEGSGAKYSLKIIIGDSGKDYGIGVYLDSTLLENLTAKEREQMVKERVKELGGQHFTAYDQNGNAVDVQIADQSARFINKNGKSVPVNKDLATKNRGSKIKQEAVVLADELVSAARYKQSRPANYPHGWLDDNGQNEWAEWKTYIQDKENSVWEATLHIATSATGKKYLYDIDPIKMAEQSGNSDTSTAKNSISTDGENVNRKFSLKSTDSTGRQLSEQQQEYFKDSKVRDAEGRLKPVYHGSSAQFTKFSADFMSQNGSSEGQGFYFTDLKTMAQGYEKGSGQLLEGYLDIKNPLSDSKVTLSSAEVKRLILAIDPTGDDLVLNYDSRGGMGYPSRAWYNRAVNDTLRMTMETSESDSEILAELANGMGDPGTVLKAAREVLGYDGYIVEGKYDNATVYVAFDSSQFKNVDNLTPTSDPDIRYQLRSAERLSDELEDLRDTYIRRYGEIPEGENATRKVRMPRKTSDNKKVSQTVRTILEANATPDEIVPTIEEMALRGEYSYEAYSDEKAISDATAKIKDLGWAQSLTDWMSNIRKGKVSKENTAMGWALYNNAANSGDTATALTILSNMVEHQRSAAQALQATRILKKLNPETQLYQVQRSVANLQDEINKRYRGKKAPKLKIDQELAEQFMRAKDQAERDAVLDDIYRDIGRQMPSRFIDKWNAWRYLAMLGNARTHVRNVMGNAGFVPVVAAKNVIATGIEAGVSKISGGKLNRSKAIVVGKEGKSLRKAAEADFAKIQEVVMGSGKYSEFANANNRIEEGRVIFQSKIPGLKQVSKGLEKARKANSAALEAEDMWFSKPHYANAMAQYCKANGITAEMIAKGEGIEKARQYAIKEAQKATYRDTNAFSQFVSEIGRRRGNKTGVEKFATGIVEGILPFRKTPANILVRGVEYSPIGLLNGIKQAVFDVRTGKKTGAEVIDSLSAGLTGTGLLGLGMLLASQTLLKSVKLRGHGSDDDDKNTFDELQGHQAYSLELPDGTSITLDWLAPECLPLFIGVNMWEQMKGDFSNLTLAKALQAASNISEPLLEMSCLQSLNDLFDAVGYVKSDGLSALPKAIASAATSYLTQALPTLLGQAERTGEDIRYTTYTDKTNPYLTTDMQYTLGKASARIPGWDYSQIPYIDAWGRTESTGEGWERALNNFFNPAYMSQIAESPMEKELLRLYNVTGESVLPSRAGKDITVSGEKITLNADTYVKYATKRGQGSYKRLTSLTNDAEYKKLNDAQKADCVDYIYKMSDQLAKSSVSKYEPDSWVTKAEKAEKMGISATDFVVAKAKTSGLEGLKDKDGNTIKNSKGLLVMEQIYSISGLTSKQREYLFEAMGVGKEVRHYNKALVQQELRKMRKK